MKFIVKDALTEEEVQQGLKNVIRDGLTTQMMVTLTGGTFLVAFTLKLGASNAVIGLLAAIPPLAMIIQIPSIYLVEKYRIRRAISAYASLISRLPWFFIALIPLFFSIDIALPLFLVAFLLHSSFAAIGGCSWNSWMRDLVPQNKLGVFFSKRMALATALGIVLSLAAGYYIDFSRELFPDNELYGYSVLFFLGFLAGMIGVYFISKIPEPRMIHAEKKVNFFELLRQPLRDINFKNLLIFLGSWNFAVNLAAPFFIVYMLKRLQFDVSVVIIFVVLSQIMNLVFFRMWGKFSDRFSNKSVLRVCGPLFILTILAWTFTTLPEKYILTIPLLIVIHIFMGISTAGITLASGNIGLKLAPKGQATAYLATSSFVNSLAAGIAPILGGILADFFAVRELSWIIRWISPSGELSFYTLNFQQWDFFFVIAFLIGLYSIHRLSAVKEIGEVEEKIVIQELLSEIKTQMRNFSTIGGLRQMVQFPFTVVKQMKKRKKK